MSGKKKSPKNYQSCSRRDRIQNYVKQFSTLTLTVCGVLTSLSPQSLQSSYYCHLQQILQVSRNLKRKDKSKFSPLFLFSQSLFFYLEGTGLHLGQLNGTRMFFLVCKRPQACSTVKHFALNSKGNIQIQSQEATHFVPLSALQASTLISLQTVLPLHGVPMQELCITNTPFLTPTCDLPSSLEALQSYGSTQ